MHAQAPITRIAAVAYTILTDAAEADGTLAWHDTTIVVVHAEPRGRLGVGNTYSDASDTT